MHHQNVTTLDKLKKDIINHKRLLIQIYKGNYPVNSIISAIERAEISDDFMSSMASTCSEILKYMDKDPSVFNKKMFMLCKAFVDHQTLLKQWPDISTFHELIGALQKRNFLNFKKEEEINNRIPQVLKFTLTDLCKQIETYSDAATSLNDILRKKSLFLKVRGFEEKKWHNQKIEGYNEEALQQWLSDNEIREELKLFDPKLIVGDIKSADYNNEEDFRNSNLEQHDELIRHRQDYLEVGHVCCSKKIGDLIDEVTQTLTCAKKNNEARYQEIFDMDISKKIRSVFTTFKQEERLFKLQNINILKALYELKDSYKKSWRRVHRNDIRDLILEVKSTLKKVEDEDLRYKPCFNKIIAAINRAYNKEKIHYLKDSFTFFPRIENFEERLEVNDNRYCYPRGLKAILDLYSPKQKGPEQQEKDHPSIKKDTGFKRNNVS